MSHNSSVKWRAVATLGLGLGVAAATAATAAAAKVIGKSRRSRNSRSDSAPGYTARQSQGSGQTIGRTVTIRKPREDLFRFWKDSSNFPQFMENLEKIEPGTIEGHSTWFIRGPMGKVFEIATRVDREVENELIAWRSTEGSEIETKGCVTFRDAPGERGTRVSLIISYHQPGGEIGKSIAKLMGTAPEMQARHDLKRFKMLMETGEIATFARCNAQTRTPNNQTEEIA